MLSRAMYVKSEVATMAVTGPMNQIPRKVQNNFQDKFPGELPDNSKTRSMRFQYKIQGGFRNTFAEIHAENLKFRRFLHAGPLLRFCRFLLFLSKSCWKLEANDRMVCDMKNTKNRMVWGKFRTQTLKNRMVWPNFEESHGLHHNLLSKFCCFLFFFVVYCRPPVLFKCVARSEMHGKHFHTQSNTRQIDPHDRERRKPNTVVLAATRSFWPPDATDGHTVTWAARSGDQPLQGSCKTPGLTNPAAGSKVQYKRCNTLMLIEFPNICPNCKSDDVW